MNKKITKVLTLASAVAMPMMSASTVFAQTTEGKTTGPVEITGFATDDKVTPKVTAYRVVEPTYDGENITGFQAVGGLTFKNLNNGSADMTVGNDEIEAAAQAIIRDKAAFKTAKELQLTGGTATGELEPGMYIVLIEGSGATVYNPVLVSVNVADANGGIAATEAAKVDLDGKGNAFVKKSKPTLDKKVVESSEKNDKGDVVAVGDVIKFEITTTLPSYGIDTSTAYKALKYNISDKLDDTFDNITNIEVKVGNTKLNETEDYKLTNSGKSFTVEFTKSALLNNAGEKVTVTYNTKLNETASSKNIKSNKNTATLEYSNNPSDEGSTEKDEKHTYHYSFDFDVTKTDEKGTVLKDAEFGLFGEDDAKATGKALQTVKSDDKGKVLFKGLDEGTYYLKETKAPNGYALNDNVYKVEIAADLNAEGILNKYTLTISGGDLEEAVVTTFENKATAGTDGAVAEQTVSYSDMNIKNATIGKMPSTGGVGTLMFTGAGVTLFLGSAAAFAKAKNGKKED